jgi:hypothetical protein
MTDIAWNVMSVRPAILKTFNQANLPPKSSLEGQNQPLLLTIDSLTWSDLYGFYVIENS